MNKTHPTALLQVHPARRALLSFSNAATLASVGEIGVQSPLIVTEMETATGGASGYCYVVDGLDRLKGAVEHMLEEVPVTVISQDMVQTTILHSLLARKHLTKSALAFVAFPLLETALEESKQRRVANLRKGQSPDSALNALSGKTVEELSETLGVSRRLLFSARNVHGFLKKVSAGKRAEIEVAILGGRMDLTAAIHSLTGHESTAGKERGMRGQLELFDRDLTSLAARWQKWTALAEPQRNQVAQKFAAQVEEWPEEVLKAVIIRLEKGVSK